MSHEIGERRTLWFTDLGDISHQPWAYQAQLQLIHGGTQMAWVCAVPVAPVVLYADAGGNIQARGVFFSEAEAIDDCICRMRQQIVTIEQRITEFQQRREGVIDGSGTGSE